MLCIYSDGSWKDVKNLMREDHSVMRLGDEAKQDKTPRGQNFEMGSYGGGSGW
jgi:hypothetical protein